MCCPPQAGSRLEELSAEEREALLADFRHHRYPSSSLVSLPRDPDNRVLVVQSGRLRVFMGSDDRELTLAYLEPGDVFSTHTPAFLQAERESQILVAKTEDLRYRLVTHPTFSSVMIRVLADLLERSLCLIEDLAFRDVGQRLAHCLLGMVERRGWRQGEDWCVALDLTTEDLARLLGSTRQTVSTQLNQLARDGVLTRERDGLLRIHDLEALRQYADTP
ncbi:MAG: Crp/Fnr family transcriptional regulator [Halorhodospira sp.]